MGVYRRDKIWYIDYRDQLGKRHREAVGTQKRVAEQALAKRKTEIAENRFLDKKKIDRIGLDVAADQFIELHSKERKRSWQRDVQMVCHLKDYFNGDRLGDISPLDIEKYMATRMKSVKPATVNREVACLKAIFNKQIYWGRATVNPVKRVKFYQENNEIDRYLSKSEIPRLMNECSGNLRSIVIIALNTGMRLSEILNLQWKDIALKQKIIYIIKSKNGERRNIPISTPIVMWLRELKDEATGDYVLDNQGQPLTKRSVQSRFRTACKHAGIENFRFHDLRHTFASYLVMNGTDLKTVQELLGHKTFSMTLRYAHLSADHKQKAVEDFGEKMQSMVTIWSQDFRSQISNQVKP